jgi:hypothetical protein
MTNACSGLGGNKGNAKGRGAATLFIIIAVVTVFLRLYGLRFGFPCLCRPDEELIIAQMSFLWYSGNDATQQVFYPTHFAHLLNFIFIPYYLLTKHQNSYPRYGVFLDLRSMVTVLHLWTRILSSVASCLVLYPLYRLCMLMGGRAIALLAAGLYAVAYLPVREAHFGVTDQLATLAATFALWRCVCYQMRPTHRNALLAGFTAGWAFSAKYVVPPAFLVLIAFATQICWPITRSPRKLRVQLLLLPASYVAAIMLLSPESILYWRGLKMVFVSRKMWDAWNLPIGWEYFATFSLPIGVGLPILAASLMGVLWCCFSRNRASIFTSAFVVIYFLFMGSTHGVFTRYIDPIVPALIALASFFIVQCADRVAKNIKPLVGIAIAVVFFIVAAAPNLMNDLAFLRLLKKTDTRLLAMRWLDEHCRQGAVVGYEQSTMGLVDGRRFVVRTAPAGKLDIKRCDYVVAYSYIGGLLPRNPPVYQSLVGHKNLKLVAVFSPLNLPEDRLHARVEIHDWWFLPYTGFTGIERPGPRIEVYENSNPVSTSIR